MVSEKEKAELEEQARLREILLPTTEIYLQDHIKTLKEDKADWYNEMLWWRDRCTELEKENKRLQKQLSDELEKRWKDR